MIRVKPRIPPAPGPTTDPAPDAESSRDRLLRCALALFAQHGFAKTSTREIAEAAQANVAAISYYFGDKAGLYRAVFLGPEGDRPALPPAQGGAEPTLDASLRALYSGFIAPLREGDAARQCMKLHMREMLEPTGLWEHEIAHGIKPTHDALLAVLRSHFGLKRTDHDLERLAICLCGLGVQLHVCRDVTDTLAPALNATAPSIDTWLERLVMYAHAMIDAEGRRRAATPAGSRRT